jgi:pimeloyl-ACP methyl ester carboxylesterase
MTDKLNYKEYGSGEPVIILHGFLGMLDNWHSFAKKLSESYRVITVDQRNHGKSFHSDDFDYNIMSEDLNTFIDDLNLDNVNLIGHSMGGKTVMQFLTKYSSKAHKAVVVDIAPKQYNGGHEAILEALTTLDLSAIDKRSEAQDILMEKLGNIGVVQFLLKNLSRNSDQSYGWKANVKLLHQKYNEVSKAIKFDVPCEVPSLFIKGSKSSYIVDSDEMEINQLFSKSKTVEIEGAGHWVHAEKPTELLHTVLNFFD